MYLIGLNFCSIFPDCSFLDSALLFRFLSKLYGFLASNLKLFFWTEFYIQDAIGMSWSETKTSKKIKMHTWNITSVGLLFGTQVIMRRKLNRFVISLIDEDTAAIRVSNLSESTQEADLQELFKPFGHIARIYLSKDKQTGQCKGFAFVHYYKKDDASKAIATLNGYGYDYLILNVEWAKPSGSWISYFL